MKYSNDFKQVIKERNREVRGRKGLDGIAANAMKAPKNTLLMGAAARRRAKNMTVNEEQSAQENTEQIIRNDAADTVQLGISAASAIGKSVRKIEDQKQEQKKQAENADAANKTAQQNVHQNVSAQPSQSTSNQLPAEIRAKPEARVVHERKPFRASHIRGDHFELREGRLKTGTAHTAKQANRISYKVTAATFENPTHRIAKQGAENTKYAAKKMVAALQAAAKAAIRAAESAAAALTVTLSGGTVAVIAVILIICMVGTILASPFGIFLHLATDNGSTPLVEGAVSLNSAVNTINNEYLAKVEQLAAAQSDSVHIAVDGNDEDFYQPQNWVDVLAVFAVKTALDLENPMDVIELDETRQKLLREVFWDMNSVKTYTETEVYSEQVVDSDTGKVTTVQKTRRILTVEGNCHNALEMIDEYGFNEDQAEILKEMMESDYWTYWSKLVSAALGYVAEDWAGTVVHAAGGMDIPVLYQYNYKKTVCTINGKSKSVSTSGCGTTSASMVIAYLTGNTAQTPYTLFKWAYDHGYYSGDGLGHDAVSRLCSNYGVRCTWVANTEKNILSALQSGYPVIAHMGSGIFTKGGHYIVLRGVTADGKILVNDPNSSKRTQMAFPLSTIINQARRSNSFGVCKPMN